MIDIAVIPVAGMGTRLLPATKSQPKEMLPIGRKPVVQYIVEELARVGVNQILFITGAGKASIENHFDMNKELVENLRTSGKEDLLSELEFDRINTRYFFTRQRQLLGLGHAVLCARSFVGNQPFVVALGDSIIGLNAQSDVVHRMQDCFTKNQAAAVIAFEEVPHQEVSRYGIAKPDSDGDGTGDGDSDGDLFRLVDIVEKPSLADAPSNLAVAARYIFQPDIFEALAQTAPGTGGEIQLTDAIRKLIADGKPVYGVRLGAQERRYDIGNFESYFRAFVEFALADERHGEDLRAYLEEILKG